MKQLKAPFPWFGGKSRVAHLVWDRFGDVANYVEPFAGSLAVLLGRPHEPKAETVNDLDCYLANFWRAITYKPETVALHADWPVNEADLHARHQWLVNQTEFRERMKTDPDFYDCMIAGWWVWGLSQWIGSGWCVQRGDGHQPQQIPHLGDAGKGIHRKLPHLGDEGMGIQAYFDELSKRLRRVRVCCGHWDRVLGESPTVKLGITGVMLDPPYADTADRSANLYATDSLSVAHDVRKWAIENGNDARFRIALCGYENEHAMPDDWESVAWKAVGGYGGQGDGRGRANANRERIWFSPHCLKPMSLFSEGE